MNIVGKHDLFDEEVHPDGLFVAVGKHVHPRIGL
jgi:hypothetical protein